MVPGSDILTEIWVVGSKYSCNMHMRSSKWLLNSTTLCIEFILSFKDLLCNIQSNGQLLNCEVIKDLFTVCCLLDVQVIQDPSKSV